MKITSLTIKNFRGIKDAKFAFHKKLNVFIGENGVGKSAVLDCIAILLSKFTYRLISQKNNGRPFLESDISHGESYTSNDISIKINEKNYLLSDEKHKKNKKDKKESIKNIDNILENIISCIELNVNTNIPLICFYPTNRNINSISLSITKKNKFDQISALEGSLLKKGEKSDFNNFFRWFRNREDLENEKLRDFHEDIQKISFPLVQSDPQLDAIRNALKILMPEFHSLRVRRSPLRMVVMKGEEEFRLEELSDGEKGLLVLVADMARRMAMANPAMENPLEAEAIFLIDEIELHLHPSWQRKILPSLLKVFPNCQFFVATHSPQVLGEVEDTQSIWVMKKGTPPYHPNRAYGLTSGEILGEIMGTNERSAEVETKLNHISLLIDEERFDEAREEIRNLAKKTKDIPALLYFNTTLTMLEEEQAELDTYNA